MASLPSDPSVYSEEAIEKVLEGLIEGRSLVTICQGEGMPARGTVWRWAKADDELALRIREAREIGFALRAERAVAAAKTASDPQKGRLAFDAERWYLGKLSIAFAEKPIAIDARVVVGNDDAFALVAEALDRASSAISGSGNSTRLLVDESTPGPADA